MPSPSKRKRVRSQERVAKSPEGYPEGDDDFDNNGPAIPSPSVPLNNRRSCSSSRKRQASSEIPHSIYRDERRDSPIRDDATVSCLEGSGFMLDSTQNDLPSSGLKESPLTNHVSSYSQNLQSVPGNVSQATPQDLLSSEDIELFYPVPIPSGFCIKSPLYIQLHTDKPTITPFSLPDSVCHTILLPLHHRASKHWTLLVGRVRKNLWIHYDSLKLKAREEMVEKTVHKLHSDLTRDGQATEDWQFLSGECPQQSNVVNCGLHVANLIRRIVRGISPSLPSTEDIGFYRRMLNDTKRGGIVAQLQAVAETEKEELQKNVERIICQQHELQQQSYKLMSSYNNVSKRERDLKDAFELWGSVESVDSRILFFIQRLLSIKGQKEEILIWLDYKKTRSMLADSEGRVRLARDKIEAIDIDIVSMGDRRRKELQENLEIWERLKDSSPRGSSVQHIA